MSLVVAYAGGYYIDVGAYYGKIVTNAMSLVTAFTGGY